MRLARGRLGWHSGKQKYPKDVRPLESFFYDEGNNNGTEFPEKTGRNIFFERNISDAIIRPDVIRKQEKDVSLSIRLDCPFVYQMNINQCGDASVTMLMSYYKSLYNRSAKILSVAGKLDKQKAIYRNMEGREKEFGRFIFGSRGMLAPLKYDHLEGLGFKEIDLELVKTTSGIDIVKMAHYLFNNGPLMIGVKFATVAMHWVVIYAINVPENGGGECTFLIHDPWAGACQYISNKTMNRILDPDYSDIYYYLYINQLRADLPYFQEYKNLLEKKFPNFR